jgi:hypothetical protein
MIRRWNGETRESNAAYIQGLLNQVKDRYREMLNSEKHVAFARRLKEETSGAIEGIRNWQHTYEDDAQFQAAVNIAVDTVAIDLSLNRTVHSTGEADVGFDD